MNKNPAVVPHLEVKKLDKNYSLDHREVEVLKNLHLSVDHGELTVIKGISGSGKTTFLNLLAGLDEPTRGEIFWENSNIYKLSDKNLSRFRSRHIGLVFQFYYLMSEFTCLENVYLPSLICNALGLNKKQRIQRAKDLLEEMSLSHRLNHYPHELSGGECQRVAIARALMNDPQNILCDEPTGNLDSKKGEEIINLLKSLHSNAKKNIIIVTHDDKIAALADKLYEMQHGKLSLVKSA